LPDLEVYSDRGVGVLVLENSFDLPYMKPTLRGIGIRAADSRIGE
jgi:predicted TIM-barrel enzyme|tara:strand:+ start:1654 stop:1788 length:135 start_codon:yes stop_codon:yes gene_type:complete